MRSLCAVMVVLSICASSSATVLYQGNGSATPESQGWLVYSGGANTTHVSAGGLTTLDTTANNADQSGWAKNIFNPSFPTLDRSGNGYVVSLDMKVLSQATTNNDRAGISVIALSSDNLGIEIAFFTNEVWAYSFTAPNIFTHGEGAAFNTTATTTYDLAIHGTTYELFAGGNSILTGNLRDYSPRGSVYTIPSFVFLGDDTTELLVNLLARRVRVEAVQPLHRRQPLLDGAQRDIEVDGLAMHDRRDRVACPQ
jgi:hypothetical protein